MELKETNGEIRCIGGQITIRVWGLTFNKVTLPEEILAQATTVGEKYHPIVMEGKILRDKAESKSGNTRDKLEVRKIQFC